MVALRCQETTITDSVAEKDQDIEAVIRDFESERLAVEREKQLMDGAESELRKRREELDEEQRRSARTMAEVKETEARSGQ